MNGSKFWVNRHFWITLALFAIVTILLYRQELGILGWLNLEFGLSRHFVERILFLLPVLYAGFVFGVWAGLATAVASLVAMLPSTSIWSLHNSDALLEVLLITMLSPYVVWVCIFIMAPFRGIRRLWRILRTNSKQAIEKSKAT